MRPPGKPGGGGTGRRPPGAGGGPPRGEGRGGPRREGGPGDRPGGRRGGPAEGRGERGNVRRDDRPPRREARSGPPPERRRAEAPPERRAYAGSPRKPPKPPAPAPAGPPGLEAALAYLARGWSVIPLLPGDKRPLVAWEEYQYRRPSEATVRGWFRRRPDAGVGIVTGLASGLVVLDVDAGHGGEANLQRLVQAHGPVPWTVECHTGGGGRHLYFAHPGGVIHNRAGFRPGLDLRGDGGYVVAPPSLHPSGRAYTWAPTGDPERAAPAPLPAWLLHAVSGALGPKRVGHSREHWRRLVTDGVSEGQRNASVASLTGHLLFRGVDPEVALELMLAWNRLRCRPPLPDDEVARTVASITRTHERQSASVPTGPGGDAPPDATEVDGA